MDYRNTIITTKRLSLIPITFDHTDVCFSNFTKDIAKYMYPQPSNNKADTIDFISSSVKTMKEGTNLQLVIKHRHTDEYLGNVGLHHLDTATPELGIWVKKDAHGIGYGNEAIVAIIEWAQKNIEFEYLKYPVDRGNISSRKIPERNNGVIKKQYVTKNAIGKELDIVEYWIYKLNK
ncbi:hypothetical protein KQ51_01723 [Candidatus Izimaplasma bacterium HR1]|uniref:GNAT family N-acetyltransferase n=1 Tax=Candidatus Izimoplasma sp. HR1 TaxID=1541959 RepID=UPI0004F91C14|nr:hypothetical protein KQ51_01723 [Candidatus Izimaplasma bacterium HR1]